MTEHTALPWRVEPMPPNVGGCRTIQANKSGTHRQAQWRTDVCSTVGLSNDDEDKANARLIVTACNNYEKVLADNEQLRKHGAFTNYEGRCQQFVRCRICKGRWEWEIEPPKHEENCPAIRNAEEQA